MQAIDLDHMKIDEKMELLNALWFSIEQNDKNVSSPEWHKDVIEERKNKLETTDYISLKKLKKRH